MNTNGDHIQEVLLAEFDGLSLLLGLLKEEQRSILSRSTADLMSILAQIENQLLKVRQNKVRREEVLKAHTPSEPPSNQPGLAARVAALPGQLGQQSQTLAQKVDIQMAVVHELAWQNHVLLSHSLHFLEEVLAPWLDPRKETLAINGLMQKGMKRQALFQAVA
jgi:hypothetical protein